MLKNIFKLIILILIVIGVILGINLTIKNLFPQIGLRKAEENLISKIQVNGAELEEFYTYGRAFNIRGQIPKIDKNNIESVKLYITDGMEYERNYNIDYTMEDGNLIFKSSSEINSGIILDKLEDGVQYYVLLRLKLNNSINPRLFSFVNKTNNKEINYYTLTKDGENRQANIQFVKKIYQKNEYNLLTIALEKAELPEEIYDIVIDAGHGGKDPGEQQDGHSEAEITLDYAYLLKEKLEESGYKVKLTRDNENTDSYTYTNMYNENGRISIACETKAKLMISLHLNNGTNSLSGFEIYSPPKSNLDLAKQIAKNIDENTSLNYSNNSRFKESDGVYVRNFTNNEIKETAKTAEKKGYAPYDITTDTPYLYTIREVGGIATNAYADGRNKDYSKNEYYKSIQGIECYQIELGYKKNDLNIILEEKDKIVESIANAITEYYK